VRDRRSRLRRRGRAACSSCRGTWSSRAAVRRRTARPPRGRGRRFRVRRRLERGTFRELTVNGAAGERVSPEATRARRHDGDLHIPYRTSTRRGRARAGRRFEVRSARPQDGRKGVMRGGGPSIAWFQTLRATSSR
jgi:hypothetical protein